MSKTLEASIGTAIYGPAYEEAHAAPGRWSHLVEEQDRKVERVKLTMAANGWRFVKDGLDALVEQQIEAARLDALAGETYRDAMEGQ
jgi:hypothetical protein